MALLLCVLLALSGCRADQNEKLSQTEPNDTQNVTFFTTCVENGDGSALQAMRSIAPKCGIAGIFKRFTAFPS